jgi:hypothetical protein
MTRRHCLLAAESWELLVRGAAANEAAGVYAEHRLPREHAADNACLSPLLPARPPLNRSASVSASGLRQRRNVAAGVSTPETTTETLHASHRFWSKADAEAGQQPLAGTEAGQQPLAGTEAGQQPLAGTEAGQQPLADAEARQQPLAGTDAGQQPLAGLHVLVVDDNELNCKLIERLLKSCGASGMMGLEFAPKIVVYQTGPGLLAL